MANCLNWGQNALNYFKTSCTAVVQCCQWEQRCKKISSWISWLFVRINSQWGTGALQILFIISSIPFLNPFFPFGIELISRIWPWKLFTFSLLLWFSKFRPDQIHCHWITWKSARSLPLLLIKWMVSWTENCSCLRDQECIKVWNPLWQNITGLPSDHLAGTGDTSLVVSA